MDGERDGPATKAQAPNLHAEDEMDPLARKFFLWSRRTYFIYAGGVAILVLVGALISGRGLPTSLGGAALCAAVVLVSAWLAQPINRSLARGFGKTAKPPRS